MTVDTICDEILEVLEKNGGSIRLKELHCFFSGGEWPGDQLLYKIDRGISYLASQKRIRICDGTVQAL